MSMFPLKKTCFIPRLASADAGNMVLGATARPASCGTSSCRRFVAAARTGPCWAMLGHAGPCWAMLGRGRVAGMLFFFFLGVWYKIHENPGKSIKIQWKSIKIQWSINVYHHFLTWDCWLGMRPHFQTRFLPHMGTIYDHLVVFFHFDQRLVTNHVGSANHLRDRDSTIEHDVWSDG